MRWSGRAVVSAALVVFSCLHRYEHDGPGAGSQAGATSGSGGPAAARGQGDAGAPGHSSDSPLGSAAEAGSGSAAVVDAPQAGEPCSVEGTFACVAAAGAERLVCERGSWGPAEPCMAGSSCDPSPGDTAGRCLPIAETCADLGPAGAECRGNARLFCAPDLVSVRLESCGGRPCIAGACVGECKPGVKRCASNGVQVCDALGAWSKEAPCPSSTPNCTGEGVCGPPPSCETLANDCGAERSSSCCSSPVVPGGAYFRSNDLAYPARVSDFRLDTFEVTVGRFRRFVSAQLESLLPPGAGRNPNDPADTGWQVEWNEHLLPLRFKCDPERQTWTDLPGPYETLPINCIDWFEAAAFCAWDGGRLPTEAEWNYVASGGDQQRTYPWGEAADSLRSRAVYGCLWGGDGPPCRGPQNMAPVGLPSSGNGRWGHANLAGNVWEWLRDAYASPYAQTHCQDCANLASQDSRVVRGGSFAGDASFLPNSARNESSDRRNSIGVRCARAR
jgi:formylglycine-generating enzyme